MDSIRVGVIGAGANTRDRHIPGLQAIDGVTVAGVVNRSRESSQRVADQFGIGKVYDDWPEVIADPEIDAIVIGTWPYLHCRATVAALEAGKHVMCEARMARNVAEAEQMLAAAQANPGLTAQIVPSPMTLRVDATVKRLIAEEYLGTLLAAEIRAGGGFLDRNAPLHWRQDFDLSGYNIMSLGIWYEALMRWVGEATRVMAAGQTYVPMRRDPASGTLRATRIPEHLNVIADMACGAQASFTISTAAGLMDATGAWLYGERGTLHIDGDRLYGGRRGDSALAEISIPAAVAGRWRVEEEFVNAIRGQETITHTDFETGAKYMHFTEAVTHSMQRGAAVSLPLAR
jgi:predicted dehydrogenase